MNITELLEARNKATADIQTLIDGAMAAERSLEAEERATHDRLTDVYNQLTAQISRAEEQARSERALADIGAGDSTPAIEDDSEAVRFDRFMRGESRAFQSMPEARDFTKATSGAGGGNTVPVTLYTQMVETILEQSPIVDLAMRMDTAGGEKIQIPTATAFGANTTAEGAAIAENDATIALVDLDVAKYTNLTQLTAELQTDSAVNLEGFIARGSGAAIGNRFGGVLSAGVEAAVTDGATAGAVSSGKLVDLQYSVQGVFRRGGSFVMNSATAASIRKLASADGVAGVWQPSLAAGSPESLLGAPMLTDDTMATDGSILFGDFERAVVVRFAGGLRIERSDDYAFANDLVTWRSIMRAGFAVVDTAAVKKLTAA